MVRKALKIRIYHPGRAYGILRRQSNGSWPVRMASLLLSLARDAIGYVLLGTRSSAALRAENLFLRKHASLHLGRKPKTSTCGIRNWPGVLAVLLNIIVILAFGIQMARMCHLRS
jgi:hypothetical protein